MYSQKYVLETMETITIFYNNGWFYVRVSLKQIVSIFRLPKASKPEKLGLAQKSIQKLKTIRYAFQKCYLLS
jgi:hypothetical protein